MKNGLKTLRLKVLSAHTLFPIFSLILWALDRYSPYSYQNNKDLYQGPML